jgi:hypothetical protein
LMVITLNGAPFPISPTVLTSVGMLWAFFGCAAVRIRHEMG